VLILSLLLSDPHLLHDEGIRERSLLQGIVAAGRAAVAGCHVALEEQGLAALLERSQLGDILGRFPVHHLAVVQAGADQHGGVSTGGEVGVGAVGLHVVVVFLVLGIAPFEELADGEGQRFIEHRVDDIDEGHLKDRSLAEAGVSQVKRGTHEQTAGGATHDG
jgi:hypothetical protein